MVHSWNTSSYHIWNHISLCEETNSFSVLLYFSSVKRLYLSQKNQRYIINQNMWFLYHCTSEDHDIPNISPYGTHPVQVDVSLTVLLLVNKSLTMALKSNISHWSLYIFNQLIALAGEESHNVIPIRITLTIFGRGSPELCYKQNMKALVSHLSHVIFLFNVK